MKTWTVQLLIFTDEGKEGIAIGSVQAARFEVTISGALLFFNERATSSFPEPCQAYPHGRWLSIMEAIPNN